MAGDYAGAVEAGQTALRLRPSLTDAARVVAQAFVRMRDHGSALRLCEQHGWDLLPHADLADLLIETGNLAAAADFLATWVERRPSDVAGWLAFGYLCERTGRFQDALAYYEKAWQLTPRDEATRSRYLDLQEAIELGELPEA